MPRLKKVLFVVNRNKPGAEALASELAVIAGDCGCQASITVEFPLYEDLFEEVDLCTVVGGDGTLLGVVQIASERNVPVLGVNLGRLGFMASFSPGNIKDHFAGILSGNFNHRRLSILSCQGCRSNPVHALNDIVIKARSSRLIRLEVHCEQEHMNTYHADGLIFSTPTGSTAYNLSAGGPIVHPSAKVLVVTPINPHTLSNRAIVLDDSHVLTIKLLGDPGDVQVSADGQEIQTDVPKFPIQLQIDQELSLPLVLPDEYSHYYVLRSKLKWTGDAFFAPRGD